MHEHLDPLDSSSKRFLSYKNIDSFVHRKKTIATHKNFAHQYTNLNRPTSRRPSMLLRKASAAYVLTALALTLSPGVTGTILPNIASASGLKEWVTSRFQRQGSSSDVRYAEGNPGRRTRPRPDLRKLIGDLKTGKVFRKKKDGSAADLHDHALEPEADWRKSILKKYEGRHGRGADPEVMKDRKYGSLPPSNVVGPIDIAKVDKERKKAREKNVYTKETSQTGLGQGLGFSPYMQKPQSRRGWAEHQRYSEAFARARYEERQDQLKKEGKATEPFRAPDTQKLQFLEYQSSNPKNERTWQRHYAKAGDTISADRGDLAFNHRFYNVDVTNEPRMARQSFSSRGDSSQDIKPHQKFDMHNTQSLPSDGRYGGEGSLLGKSPLAMGAEGPRSKSLLAQGHPDYEQGMHRLYLHGTASEQDDVQSTLHKPQSRLEKWQQQREALAKAQGNRPAEAQAEGGANPGQTS